MPLPYRHPKTVNNDVNCMEDNNAHHGLVGRALMVMCDISGWFAGILLILMATMTSVSVIGRAFFDSPIEGDVEIVQLGIAVCISACLPYAQFHKSNIIVDFFTTRASPSIQARMDQLGTLLYSLVLALMAWRVGVGGYAAWNNREVSMLLSLPVWISYALMVPNLLLASSVGIYQTVTSQVSPSLGDDA